MAFDYTDEEIQVELARLGYENVTADRLHVFKKNLMKLISSERSKRISQKYLSDIPVSSDISRNYGSQRTRSNNKSQWMSQEESDLTPYSHSANDFANKPDMELMYNKHQITRSEMRKYNSMQNMYSPNMSSPGPEYASKPKMVQWKIPRETTIDSSAGDVRMDSPENDDDDSGQYDEDEINKKSRKQAKWDDSVEIVRPSSAFSEPRSGMKGVTRNISGIITRKEHPHTRNLFRTKPFERHQMYLRAWRAQPPIGEACRNTVCWQVHQKLLKKEEVKFPQKTLIPNPYVVPTTKARYGLRWAVRRCNENYEIPPCGFFHEM
uniref:Centriolar and ciliogenesis-associated protein HYLS1 C-terminal domain-containing protein n=1 Tax=Arion vulgaris TaxID=1028688 RepID=A0A0B6ZY80_9EUPU